MNQHPLNIVPGMPPAEPLHAPVQDLRRAPSRPRACGEPTSLKVHAARLIAFGGALLMAAGGAYEMKQVVAAGGVTPLEGVMTALFVVTFAWISFAATSALAGLLLPCRPRGRRRWAGRLTSRTALVMPIYHEDPAKMAAALEVMARRLVRCGRGHAFEIVILSDSTSADSWVAETTAVDHLSRSLGDAMPVWYRRRWSNAARKAGNVREFVENWGGRYDHFIILDADSLMSAETLVALAAEMEAEPTLGILQTAPILGGGNTVFARVQQFASRVYGPVVTRGLAAWQGGEGNFWGHNAIIRTSAFAASCALPDLPGKEPLGGPILSHDFVEAALMRRAGWRVEMAADLGGSWEESPPSLVDAAVRDRRWAQGNLQHLRVIAARGLTWPSRVHLAFGVMSYLISPIWLLLILFGFALTLQAQLVRPEYFPLGFQLFPTWPIFDSERMLRLFMVTLGVLFLPKVIGLVAALANPYLRRACGGGLRLLASAAVEIVVSALFAPIMLLIHSWQICEILAGRNAGWSPQRRDDGEMPWSDAWRRHQWHMAAGIVIGACAWELSPTIFAWLSPTLIGLVLAVPVSRMSGSARIGMLLRRIGLLVTPEEQSPPGILRELHSVRSRTPAAASNGILALVESERIREAHFRWANPAPRRRGAPEAAYLTAAHKIVEAETLEEALGWLDARERVQVAGHSSLVESLAGLRRTETGLRAEPERRQAAPGPEGAVTAAAVT